MKESPTVDCLLVAGMYKSGLSALISCLQLLGVNIGQGISPMANPAAVYHPKASDASIIHDKLYEDLGCRWDMIGSLPPSWAKYEEADRARKRIGNWIDSQNDQNRFWALADTRLCRLMPLWCNVLKEKGIRPGIVLLVRHPFEVALSLQAEKQTDLQHSLFLWLALNKEALQFCLNFPFMIITYDQLIADPVMNLKKIGRQYQLTFQNSLNNRIYDVLDTVRPDLKKHHVGAFHETNQNSMPFSVFEHFYNRMINNGFNIDSDGSEAPHSTDAQLLTKMFELVGQFERKQYVPTLENGQRLLVDSGRPLTLRMYIPDKKHEESLEKEVVLQAEGKWQQIRFPISDIESLRISKLKISPLNTQGVVSISSIRFDNIATGKPCWQTTTQEQFQSIQLQNTISLPNKDALVFATLSDRSMLSIPALPDIPDVPMELVIWVKVVANREMVTQTIAENQTALRGRIEEQAQTVDSQQNRLLQLEQALEQSYSNQKTLRNVVYQASLDLYHQKEPEDGPFNEDFLNDENVFIDKSVIGYDAHWQYPVITEKHAFIKAKEFLPVADDMVYFGFPWATLIDIFHTKEEDKSHLFEKLKSFYPFLKNFKRIVTTCQHIYLMKYKDLFIDAGVTHIFWPHVTKGMETLPGEDKIKVYPFPLYPVYVEENSAERRFEEKQYLFSFVGAVDKPWYLTNTRSLIIDNLSNTDGGKIIPRDAWHFDRVVYDHQIRGNKIDTDLIDFQSTTEYQETLVDSTFSLCPSGTGPNSIRLWESIGSGVIPVVLADTYQPPGPPSLWEEAVFRCNENVKDISELPGLLSEMAADKDLMKRKLNALKHLWAMYGPDCFIYDIIDLFKFY